MELSILINKFNIKGRLVSLQPFGNGNINDTFLAIYRNTFTETQVILQRVNKNVFPKPEVTIATRSSRTTRRRGATTACGRCRASSRRRIPRIS